jgi:hypothetical protein
MDKKSESGMDSHMRKTLEYAEAKNLLKTKEFLRGEIRILDEGLQLLRRVSPSAVALAKQDLNDIAS